MFGGTEYSKELKMQYVEEFKAGNMSLTAFARMKAIPPSTFRGWLKDFNIAPTPQFGELDLCNMKSNENQKMPSKKATLFWNENIKIELKEGYSKEFLRSVIEVLINAN